MNSEMPGKLASVGAGVVVFVVLVASYIIARTPEDVLGGALVDQPEDATSGARVEYTLKDGSTAGAVGSDLARLGVIRSASQFELLVSLMGVQDKLSAGDYTLTRNSPVLRVVGELSVRESVAVLRVTFPEGIRFEEMAVIAEKAGFGTQAEFLAAVAAAQLPPDLARSLPAGKSLQGYLFPDTYILPAGAPMAALVALMIETFDQRFTPELRARAEAEGLNTHQAVTLAAIVEREAVIESERPLIARVFYNRIEEGDRLGADPTTQFVAALDPASVQKHGWWKKGLTIDDLESQNPYNTRQVVGLPPGPITNPGLASLQAVANPDDSDLYYFVADATKNDGSHAFARTLAEHEANIARVGE